MNLRIPIAMVVAAVLAFGWGAVAWTSGFYESWAFKDVPQASALPVQIASDLPADGAYRYPPMPDTAGMDSMQRALATESYSNALETGPIMLLLVRHGGIESDMTMTLVKGFVLEFFTAAIVATIIAIAAKFGARLQDRIALAFGLAAFGVCASPVVLWNFMHLPDNYAFAIGIDTFVTWLLAGLACAFIIRPPTRAELVS